MLDYVEIRQDHFTASGAKRSVDLETNM